MMHFRSKGSFLGDGTKDFCFFFSSVLFLAPKNFRGFGVHSYGQHNKIPNTPTKMVMVLSIDLMR